MNLFYKIFIALLLMGFILFIIVLLNQSNKQEASNKVEEQKLESTEEVSFYDQKAKPYTGEISLSGQKDVFKKYDPSIGMTAEEVEGSTWGKPIDINRTVTEYSVHEQWVYPNFNYLYFEDGIMTSYQN